MTQGLRVLLYVLLGLFICTQGWAQEVKLNTLELKGAEIFKMPQPPVTYTHQAFSIHYENMLFLADSASSSHKNVYSLFWPQLELEEERKDYIKKVDMGLILIPDEGHDPYVNAREFYWMQQASEHWRFGAGRRLMDWSELDSEWGLGLWQPQVAYNYLRPIEQGSLGVFFDYSYGRHKLHFMVSPWVIPSQLAKITEKDGFVHSSNRWFIDPIVDLGLNGVQTDIRYTLDIPPFMQIISHPALALQYKNINRRSGSWFKVAYAFKPMNALHLHVEQPMIKSTLSESFIDVDVIPQVLYHHIATMEWGFTKESFNGFVSFTSDSPQSNLAPRVWLEMPTTRTQIVGAKGSFSLRKLGWAGSWTGLGYFRTFTEGELDGGVVRPKDNDFNDLQITFDRYKFRDALVFDFSNDSQLWEGFSTSFKFLKSFSAEGEALVATTSYLWKDQWTFFVNLDVIGHATEQGQSFFNKYRSNDSLNGGFKYVF